MRTKVRYTHSPWFTLVIVATAIASARATVRCVDLNSTNATAPFTSWSTAATNIQDAVDAATPGDEIVVTNGVYCKGGRAAAGYTLVNRVLVDKALTVRSVNGPEATVIEGQALDLTNGLGAIRCVFLAGGAILNGFTLTHGATGPWGSVLSDQNGAGVLSPALVAGTGFQLPFKGIVNQVYDLQVTSNLVDWITLTTFTNRSEHTLLTDPDAHQHVTRFYRLLGASEEAD